MRLTVFNFIIFYRSEKINSADILLRHSDYESVEKMSETIKKLFLIL